MKSVCILASSLFGLVFPGGPAKSCDKCKLTCFDMRGPYYSGGAPWTEDGRICTISGNGIKRLVIEGRILKKGCKDGLPSYLDIWHAKPSGLYSNGTDNECRRRIKTNSTGHYKFITAMPGHYNDKTGPRAAHIHATIVPKDQKYLPLTTQIYFKDDPARLNDSCKVCKSKDETLIVDLKDMPNMKDVRKGTWNVVMDSGDHGQPPDLIWIPPEKCKAITDPNGQPDPECLPPWTLPPHCKELSDFSKNPECREECNDVKEGANVPADCMPEECQGPSCLPPEISEECQGVFEELPDSCFPPGMPKECRSVGPDSQSIPEVCQEFFASPN